MALVKLVVPLIAQQNGDIILVTKNPLKLTKISQELKSFMLALREGMIESKFNNYIKNDAIAKLAQVLSLRGALVRLAEHYDSAAQDARTWDYLISLQQNLDAWQRIESAHIAIIGCGGVGGIVAQELTAMGFRKFTFIDGDTVGASNLNRQTVYKRDDIGSYKVLALDKNLQDLRDIKVIKVNKWIKNEEDLDKLLKDSVDCMLCAADQPSLVIRQWLTQKALKSNIPIIFGGVGLYTGSFGPLLIEAEKKTRYIDYLNDQISLLDIENIKAYDGSLCASNHIIASLIAWDLFHFIINELAHIKSLNTSCSLSLASMNIKQEKLF